ncbi:MAG: 16S rRNA (guanine(527)-N(7))-methyltransferase RsmG [Brooklawnia sp.]|uniref:16S rRNA (guanine(527)-N(7))-methyltransferase RsmG n=1 Tax=Brooklawnia sp. TaxID=2699740 RepID=UPI003C71B807
MHPAANAVFGDQADSAARYVQILTTDGIERGLLGPREAERIWERHILNSAALARLPAQGARVLDVGSGAGLPGIPLALTRPDLTVVLLEPLLRRSDFLAEVVDALDLGGRVSVLRGRAEELDERFEVVTARAVAPLGKLVGWTHHLFAATGELLAMKGASAGQELVDAAALLRRYRLGAEVLEVRASPDLEPTHVVRVATVSRETPPSRR